MHMKYKRLLAYLLHLIISVLYLISYTDLCQGIEQSRDGHDWIDALPKTSKWNFHHIWDNLKSFLKNMWRRCLGIYYRKPRHFQTDSFIFKTSLSASKTINCFRKHGQWNKKNMSLAKLSKQFSEKKLINLNFKGS